MLNNYLSTSGTVLCIRGDDAYAPKPYWDSYTYRQLTTNEVRALTNNNFSASGITLSPGQYTCLEISISGSIYLGAFRCYTTTTGNRYEIGVTLPQSSLNTSSYLVSLNSMDKVQSEDLRGQIRYWNSVDYLRGYFESDIMPFNLGGALELKSASYTTLFEQEFTDTTNSNKSIRQIFAVPPETPEQHFIQATVNPTEIDPLHIEAIGVAKVNVEESRYTFGDNTQDYDARGQIRYWVSDSPTRGHFESAAIPLDVGSPITGTWAQYTTWSGAYPKDEILLASGTIRQILPNTLMTKFGDGIRVTLSGGSQDTPINSLSYMPAAANEATLDFVSNSSFEVHNLKGIIDRWRSDRIVLEDSIYQGIVAPDPNSDYIAIEKSKHYGHFEGIEVDFDDGQAAIMYDANVIGFRATNHGLQPGDFIAIYGTHFYNGHYAVLTFSTSNIIVVWGIYDPEVFTSNAKMHKIISLGPGVDDYGLKQHCRDVLPYNQIAFADGHSAYIISYDGYGKTFGSVELGTQETDTNVTAIYDIFYDSSGYLSSGPGPSITPEYETGMPNLSYDKLYKAHYVFDKFLSIDYYWQDPRHGYSTRNSEKWAGALSVKCEPQDPIVEGDWTGWPLLNKFFDRCMAQPWSTLISMAPCPWVDMSYRGPMPVKFIIDMGVPKAFSKYRLWIQLWLCGMSAGLGCPPIGGVPPSHPTGWRIQASNIGGDDNSNWITVQEVSNYAEGFTTEQHPPDRRIPLSCDRTEWQDYPIVDMYRYYRIWVYSVDSYNIVGGGPHCAPKAIETTDICEMDFCEHRSAPGIFPTIVTSSLYFDSINTIAPIERMWGGSTAYYAISFDMGNSYQVWKFGGWQTIAKIEGGVWKYWYDNWRNADDNNARRAIWHAFSNANNRMTAEDLTGVPASAYSRFTGGYPQLAVALVSTGVKESLIQGITIKGLVFNPVGTAPYAELTFSGSRGHLLPAHTKLTSDWINTTVPSDKNALFVLDIGNTAYIPKAATSDSRYFYRPGSSSFDLQTLDMTKYTMYSGITFLDSVDVRQSNTVIFPSAGNTLEIGDLIRVSGTNYYNGMKDIVACDSTSFQFMSKHWVENIHPETTSYQVIEIDRGTEHSDVQVGTVIKFDDIGIRTEHQYVDTVPSGLYFITESTCVAGCEATWLFDTYSGVEFHSGKHITAGPVYIGMSLKGFTRQFNSFSFRASYNETYWAREFPKDIEIAVSNLSNPVLTSDSNWTTLITGTLSLPIGPGRFCNPFILSTPGNYSNYRIKFGSNYGSWYDALRVSEANITDAVGSLGGYTCIVPNKGGSKKYLFDGSTYTQFVSSDPVGSGISIVMDYRYKPRVLSKFRFQSVIQSITDPLTLDPNTGLPIGWKNTFPKSVDIYGSNVSSPSYTTTSGWVSIFPEASIPSPLVGDYSDWTILPQGATLSGGWSKATPTSNVVNWDNTTWANWGSPLISGSVIGYVDIYNDTTSYMNLKVAYQTTVNQGYFSFLQAFNHPGGGWYRLVLTNPYTVPLDGHVWCLAIYRQTMNPGGKLCAYTKTGCTVWLIIGDVAGTGAYSSYFTNSALSICPYYIDPYTEARGPYRHFMYKITSTQSNSAASKVEISNMDVSNDSNLTTTARINYTQSSYPYQLATIPPNFKLTGANITVVSGMRGGYVEEAGNVVSGTFSNSFWTMVDRHWSLDSGKAMSQIGISANISGSISLKIFKERTLGATEWFDITDVTTVTHSGRGFQWFTLSDPYQVPSDGKYYLGWYQASTNKQMGLATGSGLVSYQYGNLTGTNINLPLHNQQRPCIGVRYAGYYTIGTDIDPTAVMPLFSPGASGRQFNAAAQFSATSSGIPIYLYRPCNFIVPNTQGAVNVSIYCYDTQENDYGQPQFTISGSTVSGIEYDASKLFDNDPNTYLQSYRFITSSETFPVILRFADPVEIYAYSLGPANVAQWATKFPDSISIQASPTYQNPQSAFGWADLYIDEKFLGGASDRIMQLRSPRLATEPGPVTDHMDISGVPGTISKIVVTLNISEGHTTDPNPPPLPAAITLISPSGTSVTLFDVFKSWASFVETTFDDLASVSITAGASPFTGSFIPLQPLSAFIGQNANGTWQLNLNSHAWAHTGVLQSWTITIYFVATWSFLPWTYTDNNLGSYKYYKLNTYFYNHPDSKFISLGGVSTRVNQPSITQTTVTGTMNVIRDISDSGKGLAKVELREAAGDRRSVSHLLDTITIDGRTEASPGTHFFRGENNTYTDCSPLIEITCSGSLLPTTYLDLIGKQLLAWHPLDDEDGDYKDLSGNEIIGIRVGNLHTVPGWHGNATSILAEDGTDSHILFTLPPRLTSYTICFWFKPAHSLYTDYPYIYDIMGGWIDYGAIPGGWNISFQNHYVFTGSPYPYKQSNKPQTIVGSIVFGNYGASISSSKKIWNYKTWYHISVTFKPGGDYAMFIDGTWDSDAAFVYSDVYPPAPEIMVDPSDIHYDDHQKNNCMYFGLPMQGSDGIKGEFSLCHVMHFNKILLDTEIYDIYKMVSPTNSPTIIPFTRDQYIGNSNPIILRFADLVSINKVELLPSISGGYIVPGLHWQLSGQGLQDWEPIPTTQALTSTLYNFENTHEYDTYAIEILDCTASGILLRGLSLRATPFIPTVAGAYQSMTSGIDLQNYYLTSFEVDMNEPELINTELVGDTATNTFTTEKLYQYPSIDRYIVKRSNWSTGPITQLPSLTVTQSGINLDWVRMTVSGGDYYMYIFDMSSGHVPYNSQGNGFLVGDSYSATQTGVVGFTYTPSGCNIISRIVGRSNDLTFLPMASPNINPGNKVEIQGLPNYNGMHTIMDTSISGVSIYNDYYPVTPSGGARKVIGLSNDYVGTKVVFETPYQIISVGDTATVSGDHSSSTINYIRGLGLVGSGIKNVSNANTVVGMTTTSGHLNFTQLARLSSIDALSYEPAGSFISHAVSFDGRATFKIFKNGAWLSVGNTPTTFRTSVEGGQTFLTPELEAVTESNWHMPGAITSVSGTLDFMFYLSGPTTLSGYNIKYLSRPTSTGIAYSSSLLPSGYSYQVLPSGVANPYVYTDIPLVLDTAKEVTYGRSEVSYARLYFAASVTGTNISEVAWLDTQVPNDTYYLETFTYPTSDCPITDSGGNYIYNLTDEHVRTGGEIVKEQETKYYVISNIPRSLGLYYGELRVYFEPNLGAPSITTQSGSGNLFKWDTNQIIAMAPQLSSDHYSIYFWSKYAVESLPVSVKNSNPVASGIQRVTELAVFPMNHTQTNIIPNTFNLLEDADTHNITSFIPTTSGLLQQLYTTVSGANQLNLSTPHLERLLSPTISGGVPILPGTSIRLESALGQFGGKASELDIYTNTASGLQVVVATQSLPQVGSLIWSYYCPVWSGGKFSWVFPSASGVVNVRIYIVNTLSGTSDFYNKIGWIEGIQLLNYGGEIDFGPTGSGVSNLDLPTIYNRYDHIQIYNNNTNSEYADARVLPRYSNNYHLDRIVKLSGDGNVWSHLDIGLNLPEDKPFELGEFQNTEISFDGYVQLVPTATSGTWTSPIIEILDPSSNAAYIYCQNVNSTESYVNKDFQSVMNVVEVRSSFTKQTHSFLATAVYTDPLDGKQLPWKMVAFDSDGSPSSWQRNPGVHSYLSRGTDLSKQGSNAYNLLAPRRYWSYTTRAPLWQFYGFMDSQRYAGATLGLENHNADWTSDGYYHDTYTGEPTGVWRAEDWYTYYSVFPGDLSMVGGSHVADSANLHIYPRTNPFAIPIFSKPLRYTMRTEGGVSKPAAHVVDVVMRPSPFYERFEENYFSDSVFHLRNLYTFVGAANTPESNTEIDYIYSFLGKSEYLLSDNIRVGACLDNQSNSFGYWVHYAYSTESDSYYETLLVTDDVVQKTFSNIRHRFNYIVEGSPGAPQGFWGIEEQCVYWIEYTGNSLVERFAIPADETGRGFKLLTFANIDGSNNLWFVDLATERVVRVNFANLEQGLSPVDYVRVVPGAVSVYPDPYDGSAYVYIIRDPQFPTSDCIKIVHVGDYDYTLPETVCAVPGCPIIDSYNINLYGRSTYPTGHFDILPQDPLWTAGGLPWQRYSAGSPTLPKGHYKQLRVTLLRQDIESVSPQIQYIRIPVPALLNKIPWKGYRDIFIDTLPHQDEVNLPAGDYTLDLLVWWPRD